MIYNDLEVKLMPCRGGYKFTASLKYVLGKEEKHQYCESEVYATEEIASKEAEAFMIRLKSQPGIILI
jgi:hypothetical protein